jgi:hypothetical protein
MGDIDGDGNVDLAANPHFQNAFVIVSRGHGDGTFGDPLAAPAPVSGTLRSMGGDFDRDGKMDGLGYNQDTKKLAFARGRGDGTFDPIVESAALPLQYGLMVSGEFDADAGLDLVGLSSFPSVVSFLHGNGDGTFSAPIDLRCRIPGEAGDRRGRRRKQEARYRDSAQDHQQDRRDVPGADRPHRASHDDDADRTEYRRLRGLHGGWPDRPRRLVHGPNRVRRE